MIYVRYNIDLLNSDLQTYELIWSVEKGKEWASFPGKYVSDYKFVLCAICLNNTVRTGVMIPAGLLTLNSTQYPLHVHFIFTDAAGNVHDDIAYFSGRNNLFAINTQKIESDGYTATIYGIK